MTLDASGNLLVGATSSSGNGERAHFNRLNASQNQPIVSWSDGQDNTGFLSIRSASEAGENGAAISADTALFFGRMISGTFTERARIDSSGNLLVGTTSTITVAGVSSDHALVGTTGNGRWATAFRNSGNSTPWGVAVNYNGSSPNNTSQNFLYCYDTAAERFSVRSNGGVANYSGNDVNLSDRREKTNFAPAKSYLDVICAIPVQTFNYIDQNLEEDDGLTLGVVAQDVQAVAPELVMESNWGAVDEPKMRLSVYQTDFQYALMKALQELKAEFDAYKASHP
jgi:hypothetical protein